VRATSSYHESLAALNARFVKERKPAITIVPVPDALEDEDLMEMLNVGLFEAIVVDDWKARLWAPLLPKVRVNEAAVVRTAALSVGPSGKTARNFARS
jgi:membrane-bound lytic murein transglycosylase MltF